MSMYQMVNGVNQATFFVLPMLLEKHPEETFPRFRDCFVNRREWRMNEGLPQVMGIDPNEKIEFIYIFTRSGGGNRKEYATDITAIKHHPNFIEDYDDPFDSTYMTFKFSIPDKWKTAWDALINGVGVLPQEYIDHACTIFPKIADKLREGFNQIKQAQQES